MSHSAKKLADHQCVYVLLFVLHQVHVHIYPFAYCHQKDLDRLQSDHLESLLSAVGGGLLSLTLRNRPDITDKNVDIIAAFCTQLRELDIG